jgi:hypothetical protein
MLNLILKKKAQALVLAMVLSVFLTATIVLAATQFIEAKEGGTIDIAEGAYLDIPPYSLHEDTTISVDMVKEHDYVYFVFGPDYTTFSSKKPARLNVSWSAIGNTHDLTLYGEDGKYIVPKTSEWGVQWKIPHFSIYYYRLR